MAFFSKLLFFACFFSLFAGVSVAQVDEFNPDKDALTNSVIYKCGCDVDERGTAVFVKSRYEDGIMVSREVQSYLKIGACDNRLRNDSDCQNRN